MSLDSMKNLLALISEASKMADIKGKKHSGGYGSEYQGDDNDSDEDTTAKKKPAEKKKRGGQETDANKDKKRYAGADDAGSKIIKGSPVKSSKGKTHTISDKKPKSAPADEEAWLRKEEEREKAAKKAEKNKKTSLKDWFINELEALNESEARLEKMRKEGIGDDIAYGAGKFAGDVQKGASELATKFSQGRQAGLAPTASADLTIGTPASMASAKSAEGQMASTKAPSTTASKTPATRQRQEPTMRESKVKNKYAVGMSVAKREAGYGSEPAHDLPKKVIKRGHHIAKKIDEQDVAEAKKAKKDYDGDGKIESGKDEYLGSKIAAAKKAGKVEEGAIPLALGTAAAGTILATQAAGKLNQMRKAYKRMKGEEGYVQDVEPRTTMQRVRAAAGYPSKNDPNVDIKQRYQKIRQIYQTLSPEEKEEFRRQELFRNVGSPETGVKGAEYYLKSIGKLNEGAIKDLFTMLLDKLEAGNERGYDIHDAVNNGDEQTFEKIVRRHLNHDIDFDRVPHRKKEQLIDAVKEEYFGDSILDEMMMGPMIEGTDDETSISSYQDERTTDIDGKIGSEYTSKTFARNPQTGTGSYMISKQSGPNVTQDFQQNVSKPWMDYTEKGGQAPMSKFGAMSEDLSSGFDKGSIVYWRGKPGRVDRVKGNKCFVHTGAGNMDVWPADECSNKKQSSMSTLAKDVSDIGSGLGRFMTGRKEVDEDELLPPKAKVSGMNVMPSSKNIDPGMTKMPPATDKPFDTSKIVYKEEDMEEGNAFTKALANARKDGIQKGETMKVGNKTYPVRESEGNMMEGMSFNNKKGRYEYDDGGSVDSSDLTAAQRARIQKWKAANPGKKQGTIKDTERKPMGSGGMMREGDDATIKMWENQLGQLLNETLTISTTQGNDQTEDSVSVTASGPQAQEIMALLRNAGVGGMGSEGSKEDHEQKFSNYGLPMSGDTGTALVVANEPEAQGGDMLSMIKKMAGLSSDDHEDSEDYEDEEGSDETCEACGMTETSCGCDHEMVDEVAPAIPGQQMQQQGQQPSAAQAMAPQAMSAPAQPTTGATQNQQVAKEDETMDQREEEVAENRYDWQEMEYSDDEEEEDDEDGEEENYQVGVHRQKRLDDEDLDEAVRGTVFGKQGYRAPQTQAERDAIASTIKSNRAQNRADTRVTGYGSKVAPQRGVASADTGGARGSAVNVDQSGQATDFEPGKGNIDPQAQGYRGALNLGKRPQGKGVAEDATDGDDAMGRPDQFDESLANGADDQAQQDLDFMINTISGGLNKRKTMHKHGYRQNDNPMSSPMRESTDLLTDFRKLSGLE